MHQPANSPVRSHSSHCCPCGTSDRRARALAAYTALLGAGDESEWLTTALTGLVWQSTTESQEPAAPPRRPLRVKPIFAYPQPQRAEMASWRNWGGIQSAGDVEAEQQRIGKELAELGTQADFPLQFLPLATIRRPAELQAHQADIQTADVLLYYGGGDGGGDLMSDVNYIDGLGKDVIFFVRHKSGPLYYWYEGAMARLLHQHTDTLATKSIRYEDVIVDNMREVLWRLRALCGLANTRSSRIVAIGGPSGWGQPAGVVPDLARKRFGLEIQTVSYDELKKLIEAARKDATAVAAAHSRAGSYLQLPGTTLETKPSYVEQAFLLEHVFRQILTQADCRALTINECMGTIMPMAETTACLTLSLLNDAGYQAFCESDFVVIPAGMLLANISDRPVFLNDPTYPHAGLITLAHCTAPRRMSGTSCDPVRIMTHFESDFGAAPKVEMPVGQLVTNILPDFAAERWCGLTAQIDSAPCMPICRSQIDIRYNCPDQLLAEHMPGFHWITGYGDFTRELGYAANKVGIRWHNLTPVQT